MRKLKFNVGDKVRVKCIPQISDTEEGISRYYPDCAAYVRSKGGFYNYQITKHANLTPDRKAYGVNERDLEPWIDPNLIDEDLFEI
jgi:hypothetical protein